MMNRYVPLLGLLLLAGCGYEEGRKVVDENTGEAAKQVETAKLPAREIRHQSLLVSDDIWLGSQATKLRKGIPLPKSFETERGVALASDARLSLGTIANQISTQTGIPVRLANGANRIVTPVTTGTGTPAAAAIPTTATGGTNATQTIEGLTLSYEGPLSGLLDLVSGHFGVTWYYDGATLIFSRYETRTFVMESLPGSQTVSDGISGTSSAGSSSSSGGGGSGGSSGSSGGVSGTGTQTATLSIDIKYWDELTKIIDTILSGEGTYTASPSTGTITVITTPDRMEHVADFISKENLRDSREIALDVDVYSVTISQEDFYTFSPTLLFKEFDAWPQLGLIGPTNVSTTATGFGSFAAGTVASGKFAGSKGALDALSNLGKVSTVAHIPLTTLNNRPATREVVIDTSYIASESTTVSGTVGVTQTAITPGTFQTGIVVQVTPRVLDDGRVLLQYSLSLSDQAAPLQTFGSAAAGDLIQLPTLANRLFVQQSLLTSGSTLVLAGFDQDVVNAQTNGIGSPTNYTLGGGTDTTRDHQLMVIAITPHEIAVPRGEQL